MVERYVYDPYGALTYLNASWGTISGSAYSWIYQFQGGRLDTATALYSFQRRDYSPTLGRWLQNDPLGSQIGNSNLYIGLSDSPLERQDPSGEFPEPPLVGPQLPFKLSVEPLQGKARKPLDGLYGAFVWPINWKVTPMSKLGCGGIIVQQVSITWKIYNDLDKQRECELGYWIDPDGGFYSMVYWEMWHVDKSGKIQKSDFGTLKAKDIEMYKKDGVEGLSDSDAQNIIANDWYALPDAGRLVNQETLPYYKHTNGSVTITGNAQFFAGNDLDRALRNHGIRFRRLNPVTHGGFLESWVGDSEVLYGTLYQLCTGFSNPVKHSLLVKWGSGGRVKTTPETN